MSLVLINIIINFIIYIYFAFVDLLFCEFVYTRCHVYKYVIIV